MEADRKYSKYIVQQLHNPNLGSPEFQEMYKRFSNRILWIDNNVVPGSFQMNTAWYYAVPEKDPIFEEHAHGYEEIIGFFSSDPENPYDLGACFELSLADEVYQIDRSSLIFVPSNLPHTLAIKRVDRPVFHFSVVMSPEYSGETAYK